jgi:hypothetical protein
VGLKSKIGQRAARFDRRMSQRNANLLAIAIRHERR